MSVDRKGRQGKPKHASPTLFDDMAPEQAAVQPGGDGQSKPVKANKPRVPKEDVRAIQDLPWKEAILAAESVARFDDLAAFQEHLRESLPQNSQETRVRYAQTLIRWFFPDGLRGLVGSVCRSYRDQQLTEEMLRVQYLRAEPMVAAAIADALFPIAENSVIPPSYLPNFVRQRFGEETPNKTIKRLKANLRKLGFLAREKGDRDGLRPMAPSPTSFLIVLHYLFAKEEVHGVEFRTLVEDPFWKFLGFKTEDQLRTILKDSVAKRLIAKYVVADRIESISLRVTFTEFVEQRLKS
jgi:hypothetical protein